jgi:hypothetical protein
VPNAAGPQSGTAVLENLIVMGQRPLLDLRSAAQKIVLRNVLRLGAGSLLELRGAPTDTLELEVIAEHVTCRQSGSLVSWLVRDQEPKKQLLKIQTRDCVFEILPTTGGLLEFVGDQHVAAWTKRVKFVGDACVASEETEVAVQRSLTTGAMSPLDSSNIELEGITQGGYTFRGGFGLRAADSAIDDSYVGVRNELLPGIIAAQLPALQIGESGQPQLSASVSGSTSDSLSSH